MYYSVENDPDAVVLQKCATGLDAKYIMIRLAYQRRITVPPDRIQIEIPITRNVIR